MVVFILQTMMYSTTEVDNRIIKFLIVSREICDCKCRNDVNDFCLVTESFSTFSTHCLLEDEWKNFKENVFSIIRNYIILYFVCQLKNLAILVI